MIMAVDKITGGIFTEGAQSASAARVGKCQAALIAAAIGSLALSVAHLMAEVSSGIKSALELNKALGPYSGKMAVAVILWLVSWAILSPLLSRQRLEMKSVLYFFIFIMALATLLVYPPFIHIIA